jgi:tRNA(Ile)-lysidine synthase
MTWTDLHARLHQTLKQKQLLPSHQRILVAVSGGQDSLCAIKLLVDLQPKWFWTIAIAHCDHCWSTDAGIADRVKQIAQSLNLPLHLITATSPIAETEAAAREWRYQSLLEVAIENKFDFVVTGHTKSDRAETLLYNLMRGSGADGLQSLTWQRSLNSNIQLVRPLLNCSRAETLRFCQQFQLPIWEDALNQNLKYARNRIRNELIPYLQEHFNPQVENNLAQTVEILQAEVEYLEDEANKLLQKALSSESKGLNREYLQKIPLALQRRIIRKFIAINLQKAPNFAEIEAVTNLIDAPNRSRTSSLTRGAIFEVRDRYIIFNHSSKNDKRLP